MSLRGRWEGLRLEADAILRRAGPAFTKWARAAGRASHTAHDWGPRLERMGWASSSSRPAASDEAASARCMSTVRRRRLARFKKGKNQPTQQRGTITNRRFDRAPTKTRGAGRAARRPTERRLPRVAVARSCWIQKIGRGDAKVGADPEGRGGRAWRDVRVAGGALLSRGAHGLLEPRLHARASRGPALVEAYLTAATAALEYVATAQDPTVPIDAR